LTPREAQERLAEILNVAERSAPASAGRTFGEACDEWLRYVEHERQRSTSTLRDYRHTVRAHLAPASAATRRCGARAANAMAETFVGTLKVELIAGRTSRPASTPGSRSSSTSAGSTTPACSETLGDVPPAEFEARYAAQDERRSHTQS
jgi:transposase InsO family protein